jgi:hypothetical protein
MIRENLINEVELDSLDAHLDRGLEVVFEIGLWAGVRLGDCVAKLITVLSDSEVVRVIQPVAVEDRLGIETRAVEGQLLEEARVGPARNVLVGLSGQQVKLNQCVVGRHTLILRMLMTSRLGHAAMIIPSIERYPPPVINAPLT